MKLGKNVNNGFKLLVANPTAADAVLQVGWCVSAEVKDTIVDNKMLRPHVLLVVVKKSQNHAYKDTVVYDYQEVDRKLLPIEQAMCWVEFHSAGEHIIHATIVNDKKGDIEELREKYLQGWLVDYKGRFLPAKPFLKRAVLAVSVGSEFFAAEPPSWERRWVNFWFEEKPPNQCTYRRRRILAYSIQPPLVACWLLLKTLSRFVAVLFLTIGGYRRVQWSPLFHPWLEDAEPIWAEVRQADSVFLMNEYGNWRLTMPFMPYIVFVVWFFCLLANAKSGTALLGSLLYLCYFYVGLYALIFLAAIVVGIFMAIRESVPNKPELTAAEIESQLLAELEEQRRRLSYLSCDLLGAEPSFDSLPNELKTVTMRFQALKAKYCRPFQKG